MHLYRETPPRSRKSRTRHVVADVPELVRTRIGHKGPQKQLAIARYDEIASNSLDRDIGHRSIVQHVYSIRCQVESRIWILSLGVMLRLTRSRQHSVRSTKMPGRLEPQRHPILLTWFRFDVDQQRITREATAIHSMPDYAVSQCDEKLFRRQLTSLTIGTFDQCAKSARVSSAVGMSDFEASSTTTAQCEAAFHVPLASSRWLSSDANSSRASS